MFLAWFISILITSVRILRTRLTHPYIYHLTMGILGSVIAMMIFLITALDIHEYSLLYQLSLFCGMLLAERNILKQAEITQKKKIASEKRIAPPFNFNPQL